MLLHVVKLCKFYSKYRGQIICNPCPLDSSTVPEFVYFPAEKDRKIQIKKYKSNFYKYRKKKGAFKRNPCYNLLNFK